jgi:hypothetical protein
MKAFAALATLQTVLLNGEEHDTGRTVTTACSWHATPQLRWAARATTLTDTWDEQIVTRGVKSSTRIAEHSTMIYR